MKPYFETELGKLYCGDCIDIMDKLSSKSIDFILSDYPFNCQDGRKDYQLFLSETGNKYKKIIKDIGNLLVINNPHNMLRSYIYYQGFTLINGIALIRKGALRPAWHFGFQHNYMIILNKGGIKNKWNGAKVNHDKTFMTDVIEYQNGYRGKGGDWHPQAIPLKLVEIFVKILSNKKDVVLDPFLGSGTTALACEKLSRKWIGIEISEKYCEIAARRISSEAKQGKLF